MRKFLTLLWLLFPVAVIHYHFNDGQRQVQREKAQIHFEKIAAMERAKEPDQGAIMAEYDKLIAELPKDEDPGTLFEIRYAKARARLEGLDIAGSIAELTPLLQETALEYGEDARITRATRELLGKAQFQATWVLKTNGAAEEEWRPFAERTRQLFRFLAERENPAALTAYEGRVRNRFEETIRENAAK